MERQQTQERPYRSHLQPACIPCRRRKSRCQTESDSEVCLMCRAHQTNCVYPNGQASGTGGRSRRRSNARLRTLIQSSAMTMSTPIGISPTLRTSLPGPRVTLSPSANPSAAMERTQAHPLNSTSAGHNMGQHLQDTEDDEPSSLAFGAAEDNQLNLHIVGPATTSDSQVLSDYLSSMPGATRATRMIIPVPASRRSRPVLFTKVQKRPVGILENHSPSAEKLHIIEKLLEPHAADVIDLYFRKVNPCFPLVDEVSFRSQYKEHKSRISPALLACLYAHTIVYWNRSRTLSHHKCPDSRFIWNLANEAVYSELHLLPGMSIIKAIIVNIGGRPTTSLIGNGVLLGSAVSMAHSLGLNHNPLPWEIPQSEKYLRMKIWWALLIHDKWVSLAHGTPPHISSNRHDVPQPTLDYLCKDSTISSQTRAASVFMALVGLTDVLDQHLHYIYHVSKTRSYSIANLELALNSWVDALTGVVRLIILRGAHLDVPGACNLRLGYLSTRLLLQRIELEADKQLYQSHDDRLMNRYSQTRRTAEEILILTQEFTEAHLGDFWLSSTAFAYPSTINFLLRCALETESSPTELVQSSSFRIARDLLETLRCHKEDHSWDLGDVCLAQHAEIVEKIQALATTHEPGGSGGFDPHDFVLPPDPSIMDQLFPSLWDPLQNAW